MYPKPVLTLTPTNISCKSYNQPVRRRRSVRRRGGGLSTFLGRINVLELTVGVVLGLSDSGGGGEGEAGGKGYF